MDVTIWLTGLGRAKYAKVFATNEIAWSALPEFTDADLREIGLPLGTKYMGDGILAYFGYPQAREDAAQRGVHAALGIVAAVRAMPAIQNRPLGVRIQTACRSYQSS
jgi:class 3 adenylate cyclase